ncbi:MAG: hypothetical protein KF847_01895 [Pirellulales bacterium]|nr:hypothetical protein [Pirellulales bacterium]
MPAAFAHSRSPRGAWSRQGAFALACLLLAGCWGCSDDGSAAADPQAAAKKKAEQDQKDKQDQDRDKPDVEISRVVPLLSESLVETSQGQSLALAKPGHWTAAAQQVKANRDDLEARTMVEVLDAKGEPRPLTDTSYRLVSSRPAVLAKGRQKRIETEVFVPEDLDRFQVAARLERVSTGYPVGATPPTPWRAMPSYQYFFIVLAKDPAQYSFLKVADAVRAPHEDERGRFALHYRVVLADGDQPPPLPASVLQWTSIAHLWWDEANVDRLSPEQQTALVDWLHWGGRLAINGPDSLDKLRGTFLDPYLPAEIGKAREFTADDLAPLNKAWTLRDATGQPRDLLRPAKPWSGVELKLRPGAAETPGTGGLLVERSLGSGGIVVSAVQLAQRELLNWPAYDSFLNGALLRRPPRKFRMEDSDFLSGLEADWIGFKGRQLDAHFTTPLRWMARDAGAQANMRTETVAATPPAVPGAYAVGGEETRTIVDRRGGLGAWSDFGLTAAAARAALREAAGVTVPGAGFVLSCLAVYLVVLVPLNWMVFHSLRRVEWAWLAAPLIALAGAAVVIQQAQLDIGFVSSQTEIALLELQPEHPRGHLSRFTGLYTSLSTTYDVAFEHPTAVAVPFPGARDDSVVRSQLLGEGGTVAFEKYAETHLRGLAVASSTTRLVHSEEIVPFPGAVRLTTATNGMRQIENRSGLHLADAAIVRRSFDRQGKPRFDGCWLGEVRDGATTVVSFAPAAIDPVRGPFAAERAAAAERAVATSQPRLDVDELVKVAFRFASGDDPLYGGREETRLVARIDGLLPGTTATPSASQTSGAVIVAVHLAYGPPPAPQPDANAAADVLPAADRPTGEEDSLDELEDLP